MIGRFFASFKNQLTIENYQWDWIKTAARPPYCWILLYNWSQQSVMRHLASSLIHLVTNDWSLNHRTRCLDLDWIKHKTTLLFLRFNHRCQWDWIQDYCKALLDRSWNNETSWINCFFASSSCHARSVLATRYIDLVTVNHTRLLIDSSLHPRIAWWHHCQRDWIKTAAAARPRWILLY